MKKMSIKLLTVTFALLIFSSVNAQVFQISANTYNSVVFGDLTKKEMNSSSAGYVDFSYGLGVEFKFYIKNLGLGLKWDHSDYGRDMETYETDLKNELGIIDSNYSITQLSSFKSNSFLFGISYVIKLSPKFQLEPYFNFGIQSFRSPFEHAVFSKESITYTYRKDPIIYVGGIYMPGLNFQWNITKNIGINIFVEYKGSVLFEEVEESITYSYNSFVVNSVNKKYNPQSLNLGIGFAYTFGKGLNK